MVKHSGIAAEIVSVVGFEKASQFFMYFGGKQVTIPFGTGKSGTFTTRLIELLGQEGYKAMIDRFGGEKMTVPKGRPAAIIARNRQIVADYESGVTILNLIQRYDLSERHLRSILNRPIE